MDARNAGRAGVSVPIPVLMYHNVGSPPAGSTHRGLYLRPDKFERHLEVLARAGYRGVSMEEGLPHLRGEREGRVAIITFDDGYADNLELAAPALRRHGFSATCYLVADCIGGFNAWDSALLGVRKPLMDLPAIRDWMSLGMGVGSHTHTHPRLSQLDPRQQTHEIASSKAALEDRLGVAIEHFCYPYGDYDARCVASVQAAGYATAVTTDRGRVRRGDDLLALPRVGNSGKRGVALFRARTLLWSLREGS